MASFEEGKIQTAIMCALQTHPLVAWAMTMSTGTHLLKKRGVIKVGYYCTAFEKQKTGIPDLIGQLKDGRFFGIEVKAPGKRPKPEQFEFIEYSNKFGGVAGWADNVQDALLIIEGAMQ